MTNVGVAAAGPRSARSLLQHVKDSLSHSDAAYASRGIIRLHVLFSTPRLAKDLYPFAHIDAVDAAATVAAQPVQAFVEHIVMTASYGEDSEEHEGESKNGRLMYALECFLYTLPNHHSSLLYVSKLDSSGWGPRPTPAHLRSLLSRQPQRDALWDSSTSITRVITQAFLSYFASLSHWSTGSLPPVRHLSIHVLARAQAAYLFPASNENKAKHVLSDGGLIKWWRSVLSSVVCGVRRRGDQRSIEARPFYLIPGYDQFESRELLPLPPPTLSHCEPDSVLPVGDQALAEAGWVYGHPYSSKGANTDSILPPLPLAGPSFVASDEAHIATLLPHFPDDPKSRFIAELARDSYEHAARPKRKADEADGETEGDVESESTKRAKMEGGETGAGSPLVVSSLNVKAMRERRALDSVSADEFWQRMGFRQECCAGNAVGVFVGLFTRSSEPMDTHKGEEMTSQRFALHHPIIPDLVRKHLMRDACDWSKAEGSRDLTRAWDEGVQRAVRRKGGASLESAQSPLGDEVGRDFVFTEVQLLGPTRAEIASAEEKWSAGVSANGTNDPVPAPPAPIVNTLSVKRKKKV